MGRRPRYLGLLLVSLLLLFVGIVPFARPDLAWTPSYFDDQDEDLQLWIASEASPAAVPAPLTLPLVLSALTILILLRYSPRSLLEPLPTRLRAPPLP